MDDFPKNGSGNARHDQKGKGKAPAFINFGGEGSRFYEGKSPAQYVSEGGLGNDVKNRPIGSKAEFIDGDEQYSLFQQYWSQVGRAVSQSGNHRVPYAFAAQAVQAGTRQYTPQYEEHLRALAIERGDADALQYLSGSGMVPSVPRDHNKRDASLMAVESAEGDGECDGVGSSGSTPRERRVRRSSDLMEEEKGIANNADTA